MILKNVKECKKALFFVKIDCNIQTSRIIMQDKTDGGVRR